MANFCLVPQVAEKFKQEIIDGTVDPAKLAAMSSAERHAFFAEHLGESNATPVNALFESKLLLKHQQQGYVSWARKVLAGNPSVLNDVIAKIKKLDKVLSVKEEDAFLNELANQRLGINITFEEAQKMAKLSQAVEDQRLLHPNSEEYGRALLDLQDYAQSLVPKSKNIVSNIANIPKTATTTLDFSAPLRQGWGMISRPEFYTDFAKMFKYAASKDAYRGLQAQIISDPLYPVIKKSGLRISVLADRLSKREEAYMSSLISRLPGVALSERAYVGFLNKVRYDVFKKLIKSAELRGEDVSAGSQATKDIANVINDFTGSGNIGKGDKYAAAVPPLNATFFSPRKISATLNILNPKRYFDPRISPTARRAAWRNLIGSVGITGSILLLAKLAGSKIETDPTSADFGKIVIGNTHFDITGGNGTYAVLLARLLQGKTKSTTTGKVTQLNQKDKKGNPKFGSPTKGEVAIKFVRNKLSPNSSFVADWFYGADALGNPFNVKHAIISRLVPLVLQDFKNLLENDKSNIVAGVLADMFGVGVQSYEPDKK